MAKKLDVIGTVRYFRTIDLLTIREIGLKCMITADIPLSKSVETLECAMKGRSFL